MSAAMILGQRMAEWLPVLAADDEGKELTKVEEMYRDSQTELNACLNASHEATVDDLTVKELLRILLKRIFK